MAHSEGAKDFRNQQKFASYEKALAQMDIAGKVVLDIGTGRGELLVLASKQAAQCIGIDYSDDAIAIKEHYHANINAKIYHMHAQDVGQITEKNIECVFLINTIQFLSKEEQATMFEGLAKVAAGAQIYIEWPVFCNPEWRVEDFNWKQIVDNSNKILTGLGMRSDKIWYFKGRIRGS